MKRRLLPTFSRGAGGDIPAPWVPAVPPASTARDLVEIAKSSPAPWVPPELPVAPPATTPGSEKHNRDIAKAGLWVPPPEAPRNPPAITPKKSWRKPGKKLPAADNAVAAASQTIIVQVQVASPAPVYQTHSYGWVCPRRLCPVPAGRHCRSLFCWLFR